MVENRPAPRAARMAHPSAGAAGDFGQLQRRADRVGMNLQPPRRVRRAAPHHDAPGLERIAEVLDDQLGAEADALDDTRDRRGPACASDVRPVIAPRDKASV